MSGALFIGPEERAALADLRERAAKAPVHMPTLVEAMKTAQGSRKHRQQMQAQSIPLPTRYWLCYSIETSHPAGTCRHMSLSVVAEGRIPTREALWMVAEELGFVGSLALCSVYTENLSDGGVAVNVVQPVALADGAEEQRQ